MEVEHLQNDLPKAAHAVYPYKIFKSVWGYVCLFKDIWIEIPLRLGRETIFNKLGCPCWKT